MKRETGNDPNDLTALTPAHFLKLDSYADCAPDTNFRSDSRKFFERWLHLQKVLDRIWVRFIQEVIPHRNKMQQWTTQRRDLQVGDIVAVLESKTRGVWPIGRILQIFPGAKDGHVRRASVMCQNKILDRSLSRLAVIQEAPKLQ